jgi:hypothetical protein
MGGVLEADDSIDGRFGSCDKWKKFRRVTSSYYKLRYAGC